MPETLTYGFTAFKEAEDYVTNNYEENYNFILCDQLTGEDCVKLEISKEDLVRALRIVSSMEHDYPRWIAKNDKLGCYLIGILFTRGNLDTGSTYVMTADGLKKKDEVQD